MAIKSDLDAIRGQAPLRASLDPRDRVFIRTGRPQLLQETGLGQLSRSLPELAREAFGQARSFGERKGREAQKHLLTDPDIDNPQLLRDLGVPSFFSNAVLEAADFQRGKNDFQQNAPIWLEKVKEHSAANPKATPGDIAAYTDNLVRTHLANNGVTNNHASETLALVGQVQRGWVNQGIVAQATTRVAEVDKSIQTSFIAEMSKPVEQRDMVALVAQMKQTWVTENKYLDENEWRDAEQRMVAAAIATADDDVEFDAIEGFLVSQYGDDKGALGKAREELRRREDTVEDRDERKEALEDSKRKREKFRHGHSAWEVRHPWEKRARDEITSTGQVSAETAKKLTAIEGGAAYLNTLQKNADSVFGRISGIGQRELQKRIESVLLHEVTDPSDPRHMNGMSIDEMGRFSQFVGLARTNAKNNPDIIDMNKILLDRLQEESFISTGGDLSVVTGAPVAGFTGGSAGPENAVDLVLSEQRRLVYDWYAFLNDSEDEPTSREVEAKRRSMVDEVVARLIPPVETDETPSETPDEKRTRLEKEKREREDQRELEESINFWNAYENSPIPLPSREDVEGIGGVIGAAGRLVGGLGEEVISPSMEGLGIAPGSSSVRFLESILMPGRVSSQILSGMGEAQEKGIPLLLRYLHRKGVFDVQPDGSVSPSDRWLNTVESPIFANPED